MNRTQFDTWLHDSARKTLVMGVLNVTPDSFSDGGKFAEPGAALAHAQQMVAEGADLIDVGAESTRPGSARVGADEQLRRLMPILGELRKRAPVVLSIDTTLAPVAQAALDAGFDLLNDISAGRDDPAMLPLIARRQVPVILMHMLGQPATMQDAPRYEDVVADIERALRERVAAAHNAGVDPSRILIDPGIGFGKTLEHNLRLIRELRRFTDIGRPMVVGVSRKGFIRRISGEPPEAGRGFGTAAAVAWAAANGAAIVRVHDVGPMSQVVRMIRAIQTGTP
ncbi:MAG TPA: dihydropteroate synthase [Humisphaera sp.]|jgi:dihydropteroate synthase|nr:dihydropteroate synthase [Humisphaera sp.]